MGSIFSINSGIPTTPIIDGDPMGLGNIGADQFGLPNLVAGFDPVHTGPPNVHRHMFTPLSVFTK
jgi:hypothetical protein